MRDRQADGIDGLDIKSLRLLQKIPSSPGIILQGAARQLDIGLFIA